MSPKQRVLTAFARREPDRVPVNYRCNPGIDGRLKAHFGLSEDDDEGLLQALGVDFRTINAPYRGPKLHPEPEDVKVDIWGIHSRWVEHPSGGYWDYCDWPLRDATLEQIEAWPMPDPDDFDVEAAAEAANRHSDHCVILGSPGYADIINKTGMLRTMEQVLFDFATGDPQTLRLTDRRHEVELAVLRRVLEAADGAVDLLWIGEDLGTQRGPTLSLEMYRRYLRPRHQKYVDLGRAFNIPVMVHSCGSSSWVFDDFIEMGVSVVDTLQPEAKDMSPAYLKQRFGDRLAFHGMISTAGPVADSTPTDVIESVRRTLEIMKPGGGYALAPTHQLQDNSPTENVLALYEAAHEFGHY
jgi:uroporphyrinogen decarboxylase